MSSQVTMKMIAAAAGVTTATVSMALAGNRSISEKTRARIRLVAERLNYRPNPYVSALMRLRRGMNSRATRPVVALVNGFDRADGWSKHEAPMILEMREGAMECAKRRGYSPEEFWLHRDDMSPARFSKILRTRAIEGLLLSPLADDAPLPLLKWENFAAVGLCVPQPSVNLTTVCNDHYFSVLESVRECYRLGYRRPALVTREHHRRRFHARWDAGYFVSKHVLRGLKLVQPLLFARQTGIKEFSRWLEREKPDVIISPIADTLLEMLQELGVRVPRDIGLTWTSCSWRDHPISGVYENGRLLGTMAMETLISMIERNERGLTPQAVSVMVQGVWNPGTTVRQIT